MVIIDFSAINIKGEFGELMFGGASIEDCFGCLNELVKNGWQLVEANLIDYGKRISLPVEAFDGSSFVEPLKQLGQEWSFALGF